IMLAKQQNSTSQLGTNATAYFNANFSRSDVQNVQVTAAPSSTGGSTLNLSATASIRTTFLAVMRYSTLNISVNSAVFSNADGLGCVLSLDANAAGATTGQGSTTVNLNGCSLYDNSSSTTALTVGG